MNANERNFTLGQQGDSIEVRLRTTKTSKNTIVAKKRVELKEAKESFFNSKKRIFSLKKKPLVHLAAKSFFVYTKKERFFPGIILEK